MRTASRPARSGPNGSSPRGLEPAKGAQPNATGLTAQQERALSLLAGGERVAAVAKAVGVDRATLWRWAKLPAFRRQLLELRLIAKRDVEAAMRRNVLLATRVLGKILRDSRAAARDRISAARVVLGAGLPSPAETWEGHLPSAEPEDWRQRLIETALRAAELTPSGAFMFARTPGAAWTESGLSTTFPDSFERLRALADQPERLAAECERVLSDYQDILDGIALRTRQE
jgi:transposase-like protein